jgi:hypothetical protein
MLAEDMGYEEPRELLEPFLLRTLFFEAVMAGTDPDEIDDE